ncbi:TPA: restriction endonuclease [Staphylococcus pseudintermedius]|uniref:restriction endonuclease FokI C-terminal domain-containing protein n=1 Tax=Staphylococcus nepalensis TaxID=214473 RepID=UPI001A0FD255|nr:restriction endonuclease FokI C-terminal domain-containing protein [Staphylococcus nepalensis]EGQ1611844.1 restriction endonuclease [Staphylococcus pseudintermedius]MDR5649447.1 restriction endonuclease FokI C-terminal domain-containing protein [Staphylococcus nepalensis]HAR6210858.1 restriction endonuclease [Staphylococcus pseudintermedius]HDA7054217.1 restriction endonuclease [Staphylococcus aureus]
MAIRSFGWVQNPSDFNKLKKTVEIFDCNSKQYNLLKEKLVEENLYHFKNIQESLQKKLNNNDEEFTYSELVGRNLNVNGKTPKSRKDSVPNALIQISLESQSSKTRGKKFTDEWSSDGFLRWAVSLNFVKHNRKTDTFKITEKGTSFINTETEEEMNQVLKEVLLSYPPATRVLNILDNHSNVTKFFIGNRLGFKDEPGFTSYSEDLMIEWIKDSEDKKEENKIRSDVEGTADKYARMICGWLKKVGFVNQNSSQYTSSIKESRKVTGFLQYSITGKGKHALKQSQGNSSNSKSTKFLLWEFLAVKGSGKDYIRTRRATLLKFLENSTSVKSLMNHLKHQGFDESIDVIKNDIEGINNIGIRIELNDTSVRLLDKINDFEIPNIDMNLTSKEKSNLKLKEFFISETAIPNKFITLFDLAYDGSANRDFEIITSELFRDVYKLNTKHLGGTRKPDILIWNKEYGIIADTKAYSKGYKKNISEEDKMVRYIDENIKRNKNDNPNEWWKIFDKNISSANYFYLWISSEFVGKFEEQLQGTVTRTNTNGASLNVYQLLMGAHLVQIEELSVNSIPAYMNNMEIKFV